jgi:two-component system, chemotaxis family, sensor kinase CheA
MLDTWRNARTATNFERMAEQAERLGERIGKQLRVVIDHNDVRLDPERFAALWSSMVHAVRNAVDHGLETVSEREAAGKPGTARLELSSRLEGALAILEIRDDGRGIDWDKVRLRAQEHNLPHATAADLEAAIFSDGVSTKDEISEVSGRGVGMGALKQICEELGGRIEVSTERGRGTCFTLKVPALANPTQTAAA